MNLRDFVWRNVESIARRRAFSIIMVAVLSFGGCWLWAQLRGTPVPCIENEFSYLLAGDTFAHGRMTNPTHPMWVYFETFFVLQHPTYMSIYPPAQGAFLALGKILFGCPIDGVWLSCALMCAAICWMLYAWVPPCWAFLGGLVSVLQFGIFTYWSQSYWGGAVAAMGGALVFGALPRIFKSLRLRDTFWLGLGLSVLANSQPLVGFLVAIPVACLVLPWKIKWKELVLSKFIKKVIVPLGIILIITIFGMGAYNKKITGDAGTFPEFLYFNTYSSVPIFVFQPLRPPVHFNHKIMDIHDQKWLKMLYEFKSTWRGSIRSIEADSFRLLAYFFGYPLAIPSLVLLLLFFRHQQTAKRFFLALMVFLCADAVSTFDAKPHYYAPLTCLAVLLITVGLRGLSCLKFRKEHVGFILVVLLMFFQLGLNILLTPRRPVETLARIIQSTQVNLPPSFSREELKHFLIKKGGKYLVIVKYPIGHNYFREWVYNDADIDHAPIVWARDMGAAHNARLLEYFKDRQVLLIEVYWSTWVEKVPSYDDRQ